MSYSTTTSRQFCNGVSQSGALGILTNIASASFEQHPELYRFYLQSLARELLPDERVAWCLRRVQPHKDHVLILKNDLAKRAYFQNLVVCGRLWHCPVCAAKITEERRQELTEALRQVAYIPVLITYTVRHNKGMKLADLLAAMLEAYRSMKSGRRWANLTEEYAWIGSVRSLEVTYGDNGWHPHIHELALLRVPLSKAQANGLTIALKGHWERVLANRGHSVTWSHGVDVETRDENIRSYVAKFGYEPVTGWTLEHELTKSPVKRGRGASRTPSQLLADYGNGDIQAGRLWQEYARVFKGRNQLVWSRGLRKLLGLGQEKTDEQVAADVPALARPLARLSVEEWRAILRADLVAQVKVKAGELPDDEFFRWLADKLEKWAATA